ncbi:uncharacterized protein LOC105634750 [Jatropha curcas]|uniref:uncharacterized protein LOC105634750 n=1 Tax=Jatropha curcas TaxID=180498 RepID=UPI001895606D|nr:uncharacterized protein LOC105634750 [Jatropha curcas]
MAADDYLGHPSCPTSHDTLVTPPGATSHPAGTPPGDPTLDPADEQQHSFLFVHGDETSENLYNSFVQHDQDRTPSVQLLGQNLSIRPIQHDQNRKPTIQLHGHNQSMLFNMDKNTSPANPAITTVQHERLMRALRSREVHRHDTSKSSYNSFVQHDQERTPSVQLHGRCFLFLYLGFEGIFQSCQLNMTRIGRPLYSFLDRICQSYQMNMTRAGNPQYSILDSSKLSSLSFICLLLPSKTGFKNTNPRSRSRSNQPRQFNIDKIMSLANPAIKAAQYEWLTGAHGSREVHRQDTSKYMDKK